MQCTEVGGMQSKLNYIKCGVPQGSVLGPLLFLLYINDIVHSSSIFKFTLFADDTSLFYSHKNNRNIETILNNELSKISSWLAANKLSLNVGKSKLLTFSLLSKDNANDEDISLSMNGEILTKVNVAKYLGILIDDKLKWKDHIDAINLKLSKGIGLLAKIRHYVPKESLRSLYFTFIHSHIDYNLLNWGMASLATLSATEVKIKKAIRIISFKRRNHQSLPLFKELSILPLNKSIELKYAKFMWKLMNNHLPKSLSSNFNRNSRNQYTTVYNRLECTRTFICHIGLSLWNALPAGIKNKKSPKSFANSLNRHYLNGI